ncbi:hypothetical protein C5167_021226 [Papaver somniferum]|uniref:Uncharacterized protein n=1 Tax=Papaver somniferum TaxID=3469 RepID=A0A4Y7IYD0_PAPSO|nr:hypothetical protein C5167_021226 [Papaver somniferum]
MHHQRSVALMNDNKLQALIKSPAETHLPKKTIQLVSFPLTHFIERFITLLTHYFFLTRLISPFQGFSQFLFDKSTTNFNQWIMAPGGVRPPNTSHAASQLSRTDLPKIHKQGSGDTLNAKLNDHIRKTEQKPTITIKPGIIVRKFAPWSDCPKWKSIKKSDLRKFYDLILEKFTIDLHVVRIQKAVNTMLANEYRQFRCTLHKHYLQYKKDGTEKENPHHQVKKEDWEKLCTWFESDEFQKSSTQGKKSREANTTIHCTGSKPFARYREEMCDPETGEVVEQIEFYKLTHCKNDVWTCHTAEENYVIQGFLL